MVVGILAIFIPILILLFFCFIISGRQSDNEEKNKNISNPK
jgi:hypothetical protein